MISEDLSQLLLYIAKFIGCRIVDLTISQLLLCLLLGYECNASKVNPRSLLDQELDAMHHGVEKHLSEISKKLDDDLDALVLELGHGSQFLRDVRVKFPLNPLQQK